MLDSVTISANLESVLIFFAFLESAASAFFNVGRSCSSNRPSSVGSPISSMKPEHAINFLPALLNSSDRYADCTTAVNHIVAMIAKSVRVSSSS